MQQPPADPSGNQLQDSSEAAAKARKLDILYLLAISGTVSLFQLFIQPITTTLDSSGYMNLMNLLRDRWAAALGLF